MKLVDQIEKVAARMDANARSTVIVGAFVETTLHEVADAVFEILQFPIWGRRGDAADQLAALVMLQFGEELAVRTITGTARFFAASEKTWTGSAFADASSPEEQRFYNYLCIAFGGGSQVLRVPGRDGREQRSDLALATRKALRGRISAGAQGLQSAGHALCRSGTAGEGPIHAMAAAGRRPMTRTMLRRAAFGLALVCSALLLQPAIAQTSPDLSNGKIAFAYIPPKSLKYLPIADRLKQFQFLEHR
jgi:hypothetical protein